MDFSDEGILISAKPLGEANTILELLTERHGRHLGLVRGGRSRKMRPLMQLGNRLSVTWRARLADHLGGFHVEILEPPPARGFHHQVSAAAFGATPRGFSTIRLRLPLSARSPGLPSFCPSATRTRSFIMARSRCWQRSTRRA